MSSLFSVEVICESLFSLSSRLEEEMKMKIPKDVKYLIGSVLGRMWRREGFEISEEFNKNREKGTQSVNFRLFQ